MFLNFFRHQSPWDLLQGLISKLIGKEILLEVFEMSENRFISRKAIAETFTGFLLFFYFIVKIFVTTFGRRNHFKSAFCSLIRSHVTYLTLKNDFLTLKLTFHFN